jgi:hypothetical protein
MKDHVSHRTQNQKQNCIHTTLTLIVLMWRIG